MEVREGEKIGRRGRREEISWCGYAYEYN